MLAKTYDMSLIADLPLSAAVDYVIHAFEQEKEQTAWELWAEIYPFMTAGLIEAMKFSDFKARLFGKKYKYTEKTTKEIEEEMARVIAAYEKKT